MLGSDGISSDLFHPLLYQCTHPEVLNHGQYRSKDIKLRTLYLCTPTANLICNASYADIITSQNFKKKIGHFLHGSWVTALMGQVFHRLNCNSPVGFLLWWDGTYQDWASNQFSKNITQYARLIITQQSILWIHHRVLKTVTQQINVNILLSDCLWKLCFLISIRSK